MGAINNADEPISLERILKFQEETVQELEQLKSEVDLKLKARVETIIQRIRTDVVKEERQYKGLFEVELKDMLNQGLNFDLNKSIQYQKFVKKYFDFLEEHKNKLRFRLVREDTLRLEPLNGISTEGMFTYLKALQIKTLKECPNFKRVLDTENNIYFVREGYDVSYGDMDDYKKFDDIKSCGLMIQPDLKIIRITMNFNSRTSGLTKFIPYEKTINDTYGEINLITGQVSQRKFWYMGMVPSDIKDNGLLYPLIEFGMMIYEDGELLN